MPKSMNDPAHPGGLIRDNIAELGLTVAEAARGMGVTRQQLYRIINGQSGISPEMALRLSLAFGGSPEFWLRLQSRYDLAQIMKQPQKIQISLLQAKPIAA